MEAKGTEGKDRFFDTMLREEIRRLNAHLPRARRTIKELLYEETPEVTAVDGGRVVMRRAEVQQFASSIPEDVKDRVKLPIVFLRRSELGPGAFTLLGDTVEEYALSRILKGFGGTYEDFKKSRPEPNVFYKPQISELMRTFHSLVVIGFGGSQASDP